MKYLLDTNVIIAMLRGQHGVREAIIKKGFSSCCISEITYAEILSCAVKSDLGRHQHEIDFIKDHFDILPISDALDKFATARAEFQIKGTPLDSLDLLIGTTATALGMVMVTHNTRHFQKIPGIRLEDWES